MSLLGIPTFGEVGPPALSFSVWFALFAPRGTPKETVGRLSTATVQALADPAVRSRLTDLGGEIFPRERQTPEALGAIQKAQIDKWWPLVKEFGSTRSEEAPSGFHISPCDGGHALRSKAPLQRGR